MTTRFRNSRFLSSSGEVQGHRHAVQILSCTWPLKSQRTIELVAKFGAGGEAEGGEEVCACMKRCVFRLRSCRAGFSYGASATLRDVK